MLSSSWSTRTSSQYIHSSATLRHHRTTQSLSLVSSGPLGGAKLLVMPQEQILTTLFDFTTGNSLASQFVEGVRFLHEQNVAHLDLNPANIVITATMRLRIIDFGVSVRVSDLESWTEGYRGTKGGRRQNSKTVRMQSTSQLALTFGLRAGYCSSFLDV